MRIPHFFNIKTRLGLVTIPNGKTELNIGVEDGADAIITKEFLEKFPDSVVDSYTFPLPEVIDKADIYPIIANESNNVSRLIKTKLTNNETQVVIGGDHSITFPSFLAVLHRVKNSSRVGYIQFDSHGDMNLDEDSPSKNFHGMYVRSFIDPAFDVEQIRTLVPQLLSPSQVFFIGNLDLDPKEKVFFDTHAIKSLSPSDITDHPTHAALAVQSFINWYDHIHITVDIDAFDKSIAPATGIPAESGLLLNDILPILAILSKHSHISVDISEINPRKEGGEKTVTLAQDILTRLLL